MKKDFDKYKLVCKGKSSNIIFNKNEFLDLQKCIDDLDTTLKKCAFDMKKFASMFSKKKPKGNIHLIHLTHTMKKIHNMHIHINICMPSCMAKYAHVHIAAAKAI